MTVAMKIRKGDTVEVITGKDLGRRGKVFEVLPREGRLLVEKLNIVKRHSKPRLRVRSRRARSCRLSSSAPASRTAATTARRSHSTRTLP